MSKIPFFTRFLQLTYGSYLKYRYKIKVEGFERMPNEGPFLLLANHTHVLDPFMISVVSGHYVRWVAGAYLFKNQILRVLLRKWVGSIAKQQGRSDLETIKEIEGAFKNNEVVGLFPEGTTMRRKKRTYTADFKLKVASEALSGERTIQEIAAENDISPSLVFNWKKVLQEEGPKFFNEKGAKERALEKQLEKLEAEKQLLLEQYGKSQIENVLLKKKLKIED
jgi:1-acyl-sn-glycerol-3-phosphate acyltransferase